MIIRLPIIEPKGYQYEDFVSACLIALGYFIETRIELKTHTSQILELDIVATPSGDLYGDRIVFEVKSGSWHFRDLFTIYGVMKYLEIYKGYIVHIKDIDTRRVEEFRKISEETSIKCCKLSPNTKNIENLIEPCTSLPNELRKELVRCAWFQQIAQRLGCSKFINYCKSQQRSELIDKTRHYHWAVQRSFFAKKAIERVDSLYNAYHNCPKLTKKFVTKKAKERQCKAENIWNRLNDTSEYFGLQFLMLIEHKARLAIIKNALDHALSTNTIDKTSKIDNPKIIRRKSLKHIMPSSFLKGIEKLKAHPHCKKIPYLFQIFIEILGGFYFTDTDDDIELLSTISCIPKEQIIDCLSLMNYFFPFAKNWFFTRTDKLICMKMVPAFIRGVGCFLRQSVYNIKDYSEKYSEIGWLLENWHSALCNMLKSELGKNNNRVNI